MSNTNNSTGFGSSNSSNGFGSSSSSNPSVGFGFGYSPTPTGSSSSSKSHDCGVGFVAFPFTFVESSNSSSSSSGFGSAGSFGSIPYTGFGSPPKNNFTLMNLENLHDKVYFKNINSNSVNLSFSYANNNVNSLFDNLAKVNNLLSNKFILQTSRNLNNTPINKLVKSITGVDMSDRYTKFLKHGYIKEFVIDDKFNPLNNVIFKNISEHNCDVVYVNNYANLSNTNILNNIIYNTSFITINENISKVDKTNVSIIYKPSVFQLFRNRENMSVNDIVKHITGGELETNLRKLLEKQILNHIVIDDPLNPHNQIIFKNLTSDVFEIVYVKDNNKNYDVSTFNKINTCGTLYKKPEPNLKRKNEPESGFEPVSTKKSRFNTEF